MDQSDDPIVQLINETKELLAQGHRAAREAEALLDQIDFSRVIMQRLKEPLNALLRETTVDELEAASAHACRVMCHDTAFH